MRERFQARDVEEREEEDDEGDYSEEEMVTELALRDWSERSGRGRSIEDLALPRIDSASVEAQRDRALREFTERQARMERESEAARIQRQAMGLNPPSRAGTVNLTAARPMGMLNLSAQAAGMRNQGSGVPTGPEGPTPEPSRKPAKAAKGAGRPVAGKAAKPAKAAKVTAKPVAKAAKAVAKAPKPAAKAAGKAAGKATETSAGRKKKAPGASVAPAKEKKKASGASVVPAKKEKKKKAPAASAAKVSPSPRKGSGRR